MGLLCRSYKISVKVQLSALFLKNWRTCRRHELFQKLYQNGELLVLEENVFYIFIANYLQFADNTLNLKQAFSTAHARGLLKNKSQDDHHARSCRIWARAPNFRLKQEHGRNWRFGYITCTGRAAEGSLVQPIPRCLPEMTQSARVFITRDNKNSLGCQ